MYRIIIVILAFVSLLGCASVPKQSESPDSLNQGAQAKQELKSDNLACRKGFFTTWHASTQFISNNDTIIIQCEYSTAADDDKVWSCLWNPKDEHHDCRYKQSIVQVSKEHISTNPSDRYDLFCGPCAGGWQ